MNKMKTAMLHRLAILESTPLHETGRCQSANRGNEGAQVQKRQVRQVMSRVLRHWAAGIKLLQAGLEKVDKGTDGTATRFGSGTTCTVTKVSPGVRVQQCS